MEDQFFNEIANRHNQCESCPSPKEVGEWFDEILAFLFPDLAEEKLLNKDEVIKKWLGLRNSLSKLLREGNTEASDTIVSNFFKQVPSIFEELKKDVSALFAGDPAARSEKEVIVSYPGFLAIASHRLAHALFELKVLTLPRLITENAHSKTGIDIHPGAKIGSHFCIDHGTGIVIGETSVIGDYVKLYQGVTLGALSVNKEDADKKRHPTIEDGVVIYAGATILGGETIIGKGSVIGGNVWITRSVPRGAKVYYKTAVRTDDKNELDLVIIKSDE